MDLTETGRAGSDWMDLAQMEGLCEHCNEPLGSIKYWEILEKQSEWWAPKKKSAPCN
jgi:hypothetical protein